MCGEQSEAFIPERMFSGSPPRVRGTVAYHHDMPDMCGITPACAGNSERFAMSFSPYGDHPRVCGEQCIAANVHLYFQGSPPRVRGTVGCALSRYHSRRITPACAGNRSCLCSKPYVKKDHPRVCGEQKTHCICLVSSFGSPPRVRGTAIENKHADYCG